MSDDKRGILDRRVRKMTQMEIQEDLYADDMEPETRFQPVHYFWVSPPQEKRSRYAAGIAVGNDGEIAFIAHAHGFGEIHGTTAEHHNNRREIYDWLVEWELATWLPIGPEDSEIFATKKLDPEWGVE